MDVGEVAARAARAALRQGEVDRLQAAALEVLAATEDPDLLAAARRTLGGELSAATRALAGEAEAAALRLEDGDSAVALEDLGAELSRLQAGARRLEASLCDPARPSPPGSLFAPDGFRAALVEVLGKLHHAADLLDDGEPADAAAFEVRAARDHLARLL